MIEYTLDNYEEALNKQVIHMDQAVCYTPEFRATKMMHDYPSRKLQIARSVFKGELQASEYSANLMYQSLLSRQGERWQDFGENQEDCTDAMILSRAMMLSKGFGEEVIAGLKMRLAAHDGHLFEITEEKNAQWKKYMPVAADSSTYLLLDDATYENGIGASRKIGEFFTGKGLVFNPEIKATFMGWEYFAHGLIDEGKSYVEEYMDGLISKGIDTIVTLSGQVQYLLDIFIRKLDLTYDIRVVNILELMDTIECGVPVYLYAGSFYTRYLRMEDKFNKLVVNTREVKTRNSIEFIPLLEADRRINRVTIWQKPVSAEFAMFGFKAEDLAKIRAEGIDDIQKGTQKLTLVFDPYAYKEIKDALGDSVVYFGEVL